MEIKPDKVATWNKWNDKQKASMLSINLPGEAQRLLSSLNPS